VVIDVTKPVVTAFTIPANSSSLVVPISSFTATDNVAVTGFKLTETTTVPNAGDAGWTTGAPTSYTFTSAGTKTLYAWAKDAAGNVSTSLSKQVVIDVTKPVVTAFTIPANSSSLVVPISSFTATDNVAVTGFKLTETTAVPNAGDAGWTTGAPTSYTFTSAGTKTLYAWAKDAAGNVSKSLRARVTITLVLPKSAQIVSPQFKTSYLKVYPNPFRDKLLFEFVSPESVKARIDLYDMTGRMIKTIFEAPIEGGVNYEADFKPETIISGIYIYRVTLGEAKFNGKVVLKKE
jgi:hypothetical protein